MRPHGVRIPREHDAPMGANVEQSLRQLRLVVLDTMAFVQDNLNVQEGVTQDHTAVGGYRNSPIRTYQVRPGVTQNLIRICADKQWSTNVKRCKLPAFLWP
jgi:hypothetical protein